MESTMRHGKIAQRVRNRLAQVPHVFSPSYLTKRSRLPTVPARVSPSWRSLRLPRLIRCAPLWSRTRCPP